MELFYSCAVNAEKAGMQTVPVHRLAGLCAELAIPLAPDYTQTLHTESRFVLHRLKLVSSVYNASQEEWDDVQDKICHYQIADTILKLKLFVNGRWQSYLLDIQQENSGQSSSESITI